ncbi:hypothetical protein COV24_02300 [candidate division WWE3 bacterium CG10_big_fil_rev_8_21_14_0_10_32_10]|uniref:YoaR-like putative peptidoglycan binding domain-containing protein n=1 Tax=candidate division WWE3 bacterium CG10_big_fil_rev_8_21_14_0_10_32_10 TaxID=1975090 RepID=A0A2H0RAG9_UNCKA|nr:MAG: hypothetical protein COV24_02300 [candidate division WWE3 bacterium CG10_big_fil_rev_8_21_14_0_10_32_10]
MVKRKNLKLRGETYFLMYTFSILFLIAALYNFYFINKILPGVYLNNVNYSGLTRDQAQEKIHSLVQNTNSLKLKSEDEVYDISFDNIDLKFLENDTLNYLYDCGRSGVVSHFYNIIGFVKPLCSTSLHYSINKDKLNVQLASYAADKFPENKNAYFYIEDTTLKILEASRGKQLNLELLKEDILNNLKKGKFTYNVSTYDFVPNIYTSDLEKIKDKVNYFLDLNLSFSYKNNVYSPKKDQKLELLAFKNSNGSVSIFPNNPGISSYVENLSANINTDPKSFVLNVTVSTVHFEPPIVGVNVKKDDLKKQISEYIVSFDYNSETNDAKVISIKVDESKPSVDDNKYGITELIGEGVSYFKGSAASRVSNIVTASNKIKGTLVKPGDSFSFNDSVGPITLDAGFNTAYVISKGRTVLGTGGGVCQVSTTVFRAALNSGLPITDRTAHAYRVSYYEQKSQLGLDATIYQPSVDLVFKNDTQHYILVYANVDTKNSTMSVQIYGTRDGRTVNISDTKMISQIAPPAPKYIETADLPKGVVHQVEYPAWGGTVLFTRVVKNKDGEVLYNDEFKNYYVPWAAVYEKGV